MQSASVLLFSLKDEPCFNLTVPSKVQFYMAQGKPILAMINGDGADLVKEAECGIAKNSAPARRRRKRMRRAVTPTRGEGADPLSDQGFRERVFRA